MIAAASPPSLAAELSRKALHLGTAVIPLAWALGWCSIAQLRWTLVAATLVALAVEALRHSPGPLRAAFVGPLAPMLRPHETQALTGATWLAITMTLVAWLAPPAAAIAGLWAAAVGDASAAIVGRAIVRRQASEASAKTWSGSIAAATSTALGILWLTPATGAVALLLGLIAAVVERPRLRLDDNLRVGSAVALAAAVLGLR